MSYHSFIMKTQRNIMMIRFIISFLYYHYNRTQFEREHGTFMIVFYDGNTKNIEENWEGDR